MIITQNMLPKNLRQGSLGDLSLQMWLLTSSGSVLVMVISQGETTRARLVFRVWQSNGTSNLVPCKVTIKSSERISDGTRMVSSDVLFIKRKLYSV